MTACQKSIPAGETPGITNFSNGTINREVSLDDIMSVENRYMLNNQITMGIQ